MSWIYVGGFEVHFLTEAAELTLVQNIQTSSSKHAISKSMKTTVFLALKWIRQTY
jgi:hypothetical protein